MGWPALLAFAKTTLGSTVISAGAGALSSYAQAKNANKLANQGTDLKKLRDQAEKAGFNPLTVLRATGGQGFKQNVSLGSGALASASFFSAFAGLGDRVAQRKQDNATLANTIASTKYTGILAKQAVTQMSQPSAYEGPGGYNAGVSVQQNVAQLKIPRVPEGSTITKETYEQSPPFLGKHQGFASAIPNAEAIENQYGDLVSWGYGPIKILGDVYTTGVLSGWELSQKTGKTFGFNNPQRANNIKKNILSRPVLQQHGPSDAFQWVPLRER